MDKLLKKNVKADQIFDKVVKEHVEKKKRRALCITIRGDQAVLSGDEEFVDFVKANKESMTLEEMLGVIKSLEDGSYNYKTTQQVQFPPMSSRFKSSRWTLEKARDQLQMVLNIVGFGKGGSRKYRVEADEPEGWPDEHSFVDFVHPSYAKLDVVNDIIVGILAYHGYDAEKHPFLDEELDVDEQDEDEQEEAIVHVEPEEDLENHAPSMDMNDNDNEDNEEETDTGDEEVDEEIPKLSEYERLRARNISEKKRKQA